MRRVSLWLLLSLALISGTWSTVLAEGESSYTVAKGDALETIATRFGTTTGELIRLNGLRNPDRLVAGQELRVPEQAAAAKPVVDGTRAAPPPEPPGGIYGLTLDDIFYPSTTYGTHAIAPGETLDVIARVYGISVDDLVAANQFPDPHLLQIGQVLMIPSRTGTARAGGRTSATRNYLSVPYRTQYDGSYYGDSNCGPAALGMQMAYYDEWWSSNGIRRDVNAYTGDYSTDGGSDWESLVRAARKRGFSVVGLYDAGANYRSWTIDDLVSEVRGGNPPILLARFKLLPGHEGSSWWGDHYIVFLGVTAAGDVVYHDSAFNGDGGAYRTMSQKQLMRAWGNNIAGIQYSAMALRWPKQSP